MPLTPTRAQLAVRPAEAGDVEALRSIAREAWEAVYRSRLGAADRRALAAHLYGRVHFAEDVALGGSEFLVATVEGVAIGFAEFVPEGELRAELARIAVRPDWQRRGVGRMLLAHGLARLARSGVEELSAAVEEEDNGLCDFYQANGFRVATEHRLDLELDDSDETSEVTLYEYVRRCGPDMEEPPCTATVWVGEELDGQPPRRPRRPWVRVLATRDEARLGLAQSALEGVGIDYRSERSSAHWELTVPAAALDEAREALADFDDLQPLEDE